MGSNPGYLFKSFLLYRMNISLCPGSDTQQILYCIFYAFSLQMDPKYRLKNTQIIIHICRRKISEFSFAPIRLVWRVLRKQRIPDLSSVSNGTGQWNFSGQRDKGTTGQAKNLAKGRDGSGQSKSGTAKNRYRRRDKPGQSRKGRSKTEKGCSKTEKDVLKQERMF